MYKNWFWEGHKKNTIIFAFFSFKNLKKNIIPKPQVLKTFVTFPTSQPPTIRFRKSQFFCRLFLNQLHEGGNAWATVGPPMPLRIKKCVLQELGQWPTSPLIFCGYYVFLHPFLTNIFILCFDYFKERCSLNSSRKR